MYKIDTEKCTACGDCVEACPVEAITMGEKASINEEECVECGSCVAACPSEAISEE